MVTDDLIGSTVNGTLNQVDVDMVNVRLIDQANINQDIVDLVEIDLVTGSFVKLSKVDQAAFNLTYMDRVAVGLLDLCNVY